MTERPFFRTFLPHLVWEAILFFLAASAILITYIQAEPGRFIWMNLATLGVLASAFSLSLRTATPNLAVPAIATLSGATYALLSKEDWPGPLAMIVAVAATAVLGAILGVIAGLTSAPGWAVSLGGMALAQAVLFSVTDARGVIIPGFSRPSTGTTTALVVMFVAGSLVGGVAFAIPVVRRFLGANRTSEDPASFKVKRLVGALIGLTASSLLAGVGGLMAASTQGAVFPGSSNANLLIIVGAVLLGGVSVFGRRGGIAGTVLAVTLLTFAATALEISGASIWRSYGIPAVAIFAGLGIGWALEKTGGPEKAS